MCLAYDQQDEHKRFIPVIPNNAYGLNNKFDPKSVQVSSQRFDDFLWSTESQGEVKGQEKKCHAY